jgi:hypothetical protein
LYKSRLPLNKINPLVREKIEMETAIREYSHKDVPWMVTQPKEIIDYETVFYRTPDYSVREYSDDDLR